MSFFKHFMLYSITPTLWYFIAIHFAGVELTGNIAAIAIGALLVNDAADYLSLRSLEKKFRKKIENAE